MEIIALPAVAVPELHDSDLVKDKAWALISITHEKGGWPELNVKESDKNFKGVLKLLFADIDHKMEDYVLFSQAHARQILDFAEAWYPSLDLLIIHCHAGLSRSPAVGAAISRIFKGHDGDFFQTKIPNMLVYRTILEVHNMRKHPEKLINEKR